MKLLGICKAFVWSVWCWWRWSTYTRRMAGSYKNKHKVCWNYFVRTILNTKSNNTEWVKKAFKYMKMLETLVKGNVSIIFRRMERGRSWKYLKLPHIWFAKIAISHKTTFEKFWTVEMFHWNCFGLLIKMEMATCLFLR